MLNAYLLNMPLYKKFPAKFLYEAQVLIRHDHLLKNLLTEVVLELFVK